MTVNSIKYRGLYHFSKSKNWALSWRDWDPVSSRGHRGNGLGEYVLVDVSRDVVSAHGKMPRSNNGSIADNGSLSLEDWHFGSTLSGTFRVFDSNGFLVVTKELTSRILYSGITRNGKLVFCTTANSPPIMPTNSSCSIWKLAQSCSPSLHGRGARIAMISMRSKMTLPDAYLSTSFIY